MPGDNHKHKSKTSHDRQVVVLNKEIERLQKKIYQTSKKLERTNIGPDVRVEQQRKLTALEHELDEKNQELRERELWLKYKYIRFVERTKITRRISKLKKQLQSLTSNSDQQATAMLAELDELTLQEAYTLYYPRDMKYISVLADLSSETESSSAQKSAARSLKLRTSILEYLRKKMNSNSVRGGFICRRADIFGFTRDSQRDTQRANTKGTDATSDQDEGRHTEKKEDAEGDCSESERDMDVSHDDFFA